MIAMGRLQWVGCLVFLAGCAATPALEESRKLSEQGKLQEAISMLRQAEADKPNDRRVRTERLRLTEQRLLRLQVDAENAIQAGRLDVARNVLQELVNLDARHPRTQALGERIDQLTSQQRALERAQSQLSIGQPELALAAARTVLERDPINPQARQLANAAATALAQRAADASTPADATPAALRRPITIEFRDATLRSVFEALTRIGNVNFVFDKDVRADSKVTVFLRDVALAEAIRIVLQSQQLDARQLNAQTYMIFPATQAKNREYVNLEARSFYLANVDAKQAQAMVRAVVKSRDTFIDERLNLLVVKDTPEALRLAGRLIQSIDVADPEVILDIEVLEVSRTRLQEVGIRYPTQVSFGVAATTPGSAPSGGFNPSVPFTPGTITPSTSPVGSVNIRDQIAYFANPSLVANLRATDARSNLLSNPSIRVRNREKAKIHIGEKLPVFTTNFTGATGVGTAGAFSASVSYLDVGLKLDVEPQIHLENEVAVKLSLEVSSVRDTIQGPANSIAYRIGTRNTATLLRLRDGETQILAGLIRDEDRTSASRVPGLGNLPILGRLFSNTTDETDRNEIVLLITPRVVRSVERPIESFENLMAGTETQVGVAPLRLAANARGGLALGTGAGGSSPASPQSLAARRAQGLGAAPEAPGGAAVPNPAEATAQAESGSGGQISLSAPSSVKAGTSVPISIQLQGAMLRSGAVVELAYDEAVFTGGTSGKLLVTLAGAGVTQTGQASLRAGIQAGRTGAIRVASVRALNQAGEPETGVDLGSGLTIEVTP
jgi:general secretion pathway protein D